MGYSEMSTDGSTGPFSLIMPHTRDIQGVATGFEDHVCCMVSCLAVTVLEELGLSVCYSLSNGMDVSEVLRTSRKTSVFGDSAMRNPDVALECSFRHHWNVSSRYIFTTYCNIRKLCVVP